MYWLRLFVRILLLLGTGVLTLCALFLFWLFYHNHYWVRNNHDISEQLLGQAHDPKEMESAIGYLGILFHLEDESWIAIRYVDTHSLNIQSSAIALDSQGRWYESDEHFCGRFNSCKLKYDAILRWFADPNGTMDSKKGLKTDYLQNLEPICEVDHSPNIEVAVERLLKLGFKKRISGTEPKMKGPWPIKIETKRAVLERLSH